MGLTRREFLKWAGFSSVGAVILNACGIPEEELQVQSPVNMPEDLVRGRDNWYATLCKQHGSACGIVVRVMEGRAKKIEGNLDFPMNRGKHLASCEAGLQALYHPDRIATPLRLSGNRGTGKFNSISWRRALDDVVSRMKRLQDSGESDTVVVVTPPLTGSLGMVVKRFCDSYGANHMSYETHENTTYRKTVNQLFGQTVLPDIDLENTKFLLSFGADLFGNTGSPVKVASNYGVFRQGTSGGRKEGRGTFVQVDPRFSHTAANADMWVPIKPGMEGALALSIAYVLIDEGLADNAAALALTEGKLVQAIKDYKPETIAHKLGIPNLRGKDPAHTIRDLAHSLAENQPSVVIGGGSAAAHTNGLFNLTSIYSLNYLIGSVNRRGGIIFNPDSPIENIPASAHRSTFEDWHQLVDRLRWGRPKPVKMMVFFGTDPVYGLPGALDIKSALGDTHMVSFSNFLNDTSLQSDTILPIRMHLEDWGDDIPDPAPQYQTIGIQQPVVNPPPGIDVKGGFGDLLLTISEELGGDVKRALPWKTFKDVIRSTAKQLFDLNRGSVKAANFDAFWSGLLQRGGWWDIDSKTNSDIPRAPALQDAVEPDVSGPKPGKNTFHIMPFPHVSMGDGENAHLPWLQAVPDPISSTVWTTWVEINEKRANELGLIRGDEVELRSEVGSIKALIYPNPATPPDVLGVPLGQGHQDFGRYSRDRGSRVSELIDPQKIDPNTGSLAWAATNVWLVKTNRYEDVPRLEGTQPATETHPGRIIQISPR